jgi:hypothetical protein
MIKRDELVAGCLVLLLAVCVGLMAGCDQKPPATPAPGGSNQPAASQPAHSGPATLPSTPAPEDDSDNPFSENYKPAGK